jgi:hypothetical protein
MDVLEAKRAATGRVLARQKPAEYMTTRVADGQDVKVQTGGEPGTFTAPVSASQWLDDRLARTPLRAGEAASEALCAIAAAARDGEKAARAAVREAGQLTPWAQWQVYVTLGEWMGRDLHPDAAPLMNAIMREWQKHHLVVSQPEPEDLAVRTVNQADLSASEALRRRDRW